MVLQGELNIGRKCDSSSAPRDGADARLAQLSGTAALACGRWGGGLYEEA